MRLAVYTDYSYRKKDGAVYGERAFVLFLSRLAPSLDRMVLVGRLNPEPGHCRYPLADEIDFVPLPYYASAARPLNAAAAMLVSLRRFWKVLGEVDTVWLLGPHPLALSFVLLAALRRRRITLGVRQDYLAYVRSRHPGRRSLALAALVLEWAYRALARAFSVVVVGPLLERHYSRARRLLSISVSLIDEGDILPESSGADRSFDGELRVLSVGRLETEKNPLLLADILARLNRSERRWRLVVCGEGPMEPELDRRLRELGVREQAELRGYVPLDSGLMEIYRDSHLFLHVSLTEGLPQVLFEAFATRLPIVATAVGGVTEVARDAALLVPPGDPDAAASALVRIADDPSLRARLTRAGVARARRHTIEVERGRLIEFLDPGPAAT